MQIIRTIMVAGALVASSGFMSAQAQEIRLARQFSMGYLQFNVMEHEKLLEKHAAALGLKDVKIVWSTFNGPDAMNNALISDSIDIVAGGVPGLLTLWNRTNGHARTRCRASRRCPRSRSCSTRAATTSNRSPT